MSAAYDRFISDRHLAVLAASGIDAEQAHKRGYETIRDPRRLRGEIGIADDGCRTQGILIPLLDVTGRRWGYQYRPDSPRERNGKLVKYETPINQRNGIDVPPGVGERLGDPNEPLFITEGSKKADSAAAHGLCCVSLSGVWNWRGKNSKGGKELIADFHSIALNDRPVVIAYDGDAARKPSVQKAMTELAGVLSNKGARVRYLHLPDEDLKVGLDDYLTSGHTVADLWKLVQPAGSEDPGDSEAPRVWKATDLKPATQPRWLAKGRIQCAATNLLCGDEGIGKSLLWVWIAAAVTTGKPLPEFGIPARDPAQVLLVVTEDDWSSTVLPRLEVAGADLERVSVICVERDGSGAPVFPRDINLIAEAETRPALVVIDAWLDTVPHGLRVRDPQDARLALHGWKELATETGAAVLLLVHTNRINSANTRDRYGATYALRQKARMTLYAQNDEEGRLLVGPEKMNNGAPAAASIFSIDAVQHFEPTADDDGTVPLLVHVGTSDRTASEHVADQFEDDRGEDRSTVENATGWLQSYLDVEGPNADGADVKRVAAKNGIKDRTLLNAAKKLQVVYGRTGFGKDTKSTWSLPSQTVRDCATGEKEDIIAGHTVTHQSRTVGGACATDAQLTDQQKRGENGQSRQSRTEIHTPAPLILRADDYRRPGCVCIGQPRPCDYCEMMTSKQSGQVSP